MNDLFISKCQFWLSVLFLGGYFTVMILFMLGYSRIPDGMQEIFSGLVSLLTAGGLAIVYFWFQRARGGSSATT